MASRGPGKKQPMHATRGSHFTRSSVSGTGAQVFCSFETFPKTGAFCGIPTSAN
jgi:hypothetical protein